MRTADELVSGAFVIPNMSSNPLIIDELSRCSKRRQLRLW
jgi:hypothetical protein